jgi:hypothetical protein
MKRPSDRGLSPEEDRKRLRRRRKAAKEKRPLLAERFEQGLDLWTGKPLQGADRLEHEELKEEAETEAHKQRVKNLSELLDERKGA